MINLHTLYEAFLGEVNTYQGGHVQPQRVFQSWVRDISLSFFHALCKEYEKSQVMSDRISPFLRSVNVRVESQPRKGHGLARYPKDYIYFASARAYQDKGSYLADPSLPLVCPDQEEECSCDSKLDKDHIMKSDQTIPETTIEKVDNGRWGAINSHAFLKPTFEKPLMTQYDEGFKVAPAGIGVFVMDFFRLPKDPVYNYRITGAGTEDEYFEYVAEGSVHLEWSADMIPDFLAALKTKYGSYVRNEQLYQQGVRESK